MMTTITENKRESLGIRGGLTLLPRSWSEYLDALSRTHGGALETTQGSAATTPPSGTLVIRRRYPRGYRTRDLEGSVWESFNLPRRTCEVLKRDRERAWVGDALLTADLRRACIDSRGRVDQNFVNVASANRTMHDFLSTQHAGLLRAFRGSRASIHAVATWFEALYASSASVREDYWVWLTGRECVQLPTNVDRYAPPAREEGSAALAAPLSDGTCWRALFETNDTTPSLPEWVWPRWSEVRMLATTVPLSSRNVTLRVSAVGFIHVQEDAQSPLKPKDLLSIAVDGSMRVGGLVPPRSNHQRRAVKHRVASLTSEALAGSENLWVVWRVLLTLSHLLCLALAKYSARVVGERLPVTPTLPGFCYLRCFSVPRRARIARLLGPYPRWRAIAGAKPDYLPTGVTKCGYAVCHVDGASRVTPCQLKQGWSRLRLCGMKVGAAPGKLPGTVERLGERGELLRAFRGTPSTAEPEDWAPGTLTGGWEPFHNGHIRGTPDFMWRADLTERGWRAAEHNTLHRLAPSFFDHVRHPGTLPSLEGARKVWNEAVSGWRAYSRGLPSGAVVVITAGNKAACEATRVAPWDLVPGATHGFAFCCSGDVSDVADGWGGYRLPLPTGRSRRYLAGLRIIPLLAGRADIQIAIVNGTAPHAHPLHELSKLLSRHPALAAVVPRWVPVNMGATAARGCVLEADAGHIRASFCELGDVYGWDETVLYVRNPTALVVPDGAACVNYNDGFFMENVTWLARIGDWGYRAHTFKRWGVLEMIAHLDGLPLRGDSRHGGYTINSPFKPLKYVLQERDAWLARKGASTLQWGEDAIRFERTGSRYTTRIEAFDPDYPEVGDNFAGGTWRAYDRCCGARNTLDTSITQSIHPEIWADVAKGSPEADVEIVRAFDTAARHIGDWASRLPEPAGVIGVAAVPSRRVADEFREARGHLFKHWVFLTEGAGGEVGLDLFVTLPTTYATGFAFQLARLLPGIYSPRSAVFSCVNDLETDALPRELRLEVGLRALAYEPCVFPAMALNAPCPFQDVTFRGDAFSRKSVSLLNTIAKWGWVYGVDEVWACCQDFPTVAVEARVNNCATSNFANPQPARLWLPTGDSLQELQTPAGNFREAVTEPGKLVARRVTKTWAEWLITWFRNPRDLVIDLSPRVIEWDRARWELLGPQATLRLLEARATTFTIFTWGTRGDHVPLEAAARQLVKGGAIVNLVALCTLEAGKENLARCERGVAHKFIPELVSAAAVAAACPGPCIAPDYLTWGSGLSYSLRPADRDATPPRGGLHRYIDWVVPLLYWNERAKVRIGCYRGAKWFPRSANGSTFLPTQRVVRSREARRAIVLGSSTIPVPDEYQDWEVVPPGDHFAEFQKYTTIACAGGAGVVQTAALAGARVEAWDRSIDRQYRRPLDAGAGVDGNEEPSKWWLLLLSQRPILLIRHCKLSPRKWINALKWLVWRHSVLSRVWHVLFVAYSMRYTHILPSLEETIVGALLPGFKRTSVVGNITKIFLIAGLKGTLSRMGVSVWRFAWVLSKRISSALFHPFSHTLTMLGWHPVTSAAITALVLEITPDFRRYGQTWGFNLSLSSNTHSGVWFTLAPVWVAGLPLGMHSTLWSADRGERMQGVHLGGRNVMGNPFTLRTHYVASIQPFFAIKTHLPDDVGLWERNTVLPYSALWNCQTMTAGLYIRHAKAIVLSEILLLGFWTGYASSFMLLFSFVGWFAGSSALVALWAAAPLEKAFPHLQITRAVGAARAWVGSLTVGFAEQDPLQRDDQEATNSLLGPPGGPARLVSATELELRDAAALLCADAIRSGVYDDVVFQAMSHALPEALASAEGASDAPFTNALVSELYRSRRGLTDVPLNYQGREHGSFSAAIIRYAYDHGISTRFVEGACAWVGRVFSANTAVSERLLTWVARLADMLAINNYLPRAGELASQLGHLLNAGDPRATARRKNAWAILRGKDIESLRRSDWLQLSLAEASFSGSPERAIPDMVKRLNEYAPPEQKPLDPDAVFKRPVFRPDCPRVAEQELEYPSLLQTVAAQVDPTLTKRVEKYLDLGGSVGIDGVWTATPENIDASLERYYAPHPALSESDIARAQDVAAALYDAHPEAFRAPGVVSPETVRHHLVMKYSPGLPFIGRYKTRAELVRTGWMRSIIQATYKSLETGEYPAQAYHVFPKMMVLGAEKLTSAPGKVRTVVAQDLPSVFVDQVVQLERNKRTIWQTCDVGIGAPLTASYLGRVFDRVRERRTVFNADVTAFDANCPPVLFEVLSILAELGAADGGNPRVGSILRSKYSSMQFADLRILETGARASKLRGGATGQSATSWDNTWAARAAFIMCWSDVTGRPAADFYKFNTIHNTGDDNVWGTDSDLDPELLSRAAERLLGMKLRIEGRDSEGTLSYLSKIPRDSAEFRDELAVHFPGRTFQGTTAIHDLGRLLTRRAGLPTQFSGAQPSRFYRGLLERTIGHAMLTWHQPDAYSMLAEEWIADATRYLGPRAKRVVFDVVRDASGHVTAVHARPGRHATLSTTEQHKLNLLSRGALKLPTYHKVMETAYAEKRAQPLSKYAYATLPPTWEAIARDVIVRARTAFNRYVPDELGKLSPASAAAPLTLLFHVWGYPIEKFVWRCLSAGREDPVTYNEFALALRNSPYAAATDVNGFWWYATSPGMPDRLAAESENVVRGRVAVATVWYVIITNLLAAARRLPVAGLLIEMTEIYSRDAPRLFAVLNTLHWHETATSSEVISSLLPRDPFASQKRLAVSLAALTPDFVCVLAGPLTRTGLLAGFSEAVAAVRRFRIGNSGDLAFSTPEHNEWDPHAEAILTRAKGNPEGVVVRAPTGTGKSTKMIAALLPHMGSARIWLLLPRIVQRESYRNPWLAESLVCKLALGLQDTGAPVLVATYGHVLARHAGGAGPQHSDLVIFDEIHENLPEMGIALATIPGHRVLASATPHLLFSRGHDTLNLELPQPFKPVQPVRLSLDVLGLWQEAKRTPDVDTTRCLFIVPTLAEVDAVRDALLSAGEQATALTSRSRMVAETGHLIATSIVDTGVTLSPPPTCLIDSGETMVMHHGTLRRLPTSHATDIQRRGRVGRLRAAAVFANILAGTGPDPVPTATFSRIATLNDDVRAVLLNGYEAKIRLSPVVGAGLSPSPADPFMAIVCPDVNPDIIVGLATIWWLRCELVDVRKAWDAYQLLESRGWNEHTEGLRKLLLGKTGSAWLPPPELLQKSLAYDPFVVIEDGAARRAALVSFRDGSYCAS